MGSGGRPGRLPGELTEFIGQRGELALVRQALSAARLVTLTGPGGIGKTRLALRAADSARRAFRDGAWLTELGGLRDPGLLVPEVARSLGLSDQSGRWAVANLSNYLADRQLLLVIDQCEHLADACAVLVDALLRACPGLRIIATSRHVLGVAGEVTVAVPPMTVPPVTIPAEGGICCGTRRRNRRHDRPCSPPRTSHGSRSGSRTWRHWSPVGCPTDRSRPRW